MRQNITLECVETGERLHLTSKNKWNNPGRIELKKYSPKLHRRATLEEAKQASGKKEAEWAYQLRSFLDSQGLEKQRRPTKPHESHPVPGKKLL